MAEKKRMRALIADDEPHIRFYIRSALESMKIEVVGEATNGMEALTMYRDEKPHLLMLDINMPLKTGDAVLGELISEFPNAFVIVLTAAFKQDLVEKCIDLGAANLIRKDTPIPKIKQIIKESWNAHKKKIRSR